MAGRNKGTPKTGGRTKGVPNRSSAKVKSLIGKLLEDKYNKFEQELEQLDGKDYVTAYLKLIEYVVPKQRQKMQTISFNNLSDEEAQELLDEITERLKNT